MQSPRPPQASRLVSQFKIARLNRVCLHYARPVDHALSLHAFSPCWAQTVVSDLLQVTNLSTYATQIREGLSQLGVGETQR